MEQIRTGNTRSLLNSHNKIARTTTLALIAPFFFITGVFASESPGTINNGIQETNMTQQKNQTITGKVVDKNGEPIIGANVLVKGTTNGTVTDVDGNYTLDVPENAVLQISYIGYLTQELPVLNKTVITVRLVEDTQSLDEVVVVGYGTQKKGEIASAISSVKSDNFVKIPTTDAAQLIRGQVAGLNVVTPDANPVGKSQITLRGAGTLKSSTTPLVLIDGVPGDMDTVSPDAIEQIDILKDGSAAAIYGTRGTNGVILITTKNAKGEMPTEIDVNAYLATQQITRRLSFFDADGYRNLVAQGKPGAQDDGASTDWLDEVMQTPLTQIYNISLRGGSRNTNYVASFEYRGIEGIMKRTKNQMYYPRVDITHRMFDNKLKITAHLSGYKQTYFAGSDDDNGFNKEVYRNAITYNPTTPVKDADGKWSESPSKTDYLNPVGLIEEVEGENQATNLRMHASASFTPIDGLEIKYLVSSNNYNQVRGYYETTDHISSYKNGRTGFASRGTKRKVDDMSELTASYRKTIKDHTFNILAGYSWMRTNYQFYWMQNFNFPSDDYTYNGMQTGQALKDGRANENSEQKENKLIGYFGRFNYSYKGKYMLAASIRHEGSSKFGANHKWGNFPSVSGAWSIKDEAFLEDSKLLSQLKLRAGYGITGTEPDDPYMSLNTLDFGTYVYYNGGFIKTTRPGSNSNSDLRWEKKKETNVGLDLGFLEDRITATIDFYNRKTEDLLWDYSVPTPPFLYSKMTANGGSIRNRGLEVSVTTIPIQTQDWQWITSMNYSTNKSELLSLSSDQYVSNDYSDQGNLPEPLQMASHRIQVGEPIGNFYGYKSIDIDENGHWIIEGADGNPKPIEDQVPDDKQVIGNGVPKHYLNWNNTVRFKNFDLSVTMRGAFGFDILNTPRMRFGVPVMLSRGNVLESSFDNVYGKRPLADDQGIQYVSYYVEKGDYWKIDNLTLGYTINFNKWLKSLRVYGTISNLATITGYSGIDPEVGISGLNPGVDDISRYPAARTYTLGVSVKF